MNLKTTGLKLPTKAVVDSPQQKTWSSPSNLPGHSVSPGITDNHGRVINYLRLAITDRCNLRCLYCLPAKGVSFNHQTELLTWDEMETICRIFLQLGIRKIRITGGEPFARSGLMDFLHTLKRIDPELEIGITTNGVLVGNYFHDLEGTGIKRLNFSLDSRDENTFRLIVRRNYFSKVIENLYRAQSQGFIVKINMVVLPGINDHEIPSFVEWTRDENWTIRFIEPMPFDMQGGQYSNLTSGKTMLSRIKSRFRVESVAASSNSVTQLYKVPGYNGKFGIINGYTRSFCGGCSRIRISASGDLLTCLYGKREANLRDLLREGVPEEQIRDLVVSRVQHRQQDGFEAMAERNQEDFSSMSLIGG